MLVVATCFWDKNEYTHKLSGTFTEAWVERLYRGFRRNLTVSFRFVCFTERLRKYHEPIEQELLAAKVPQFGSFTEPYRLGEPMILVGLDTLIVRNIDHFAQWCLTGDKIALLRDAKSYRLKAQGYPDQSINGVALVPKGWKCVYDEWDGVENDMTHLRNFPWVAIDDKWSREQVASYKMQVRNDGDRLKSAMRIVYFHGQPKMDTLTHLDFVREHWR